MKKSVLIEKEEIRRGSWILLVFFILGVIIMIGGSFFLGTFQNIITLWSFYLATILVGLSLIGLFMYKKWGFYLFTLYLIYLLISNIIHLLSNFASFWVTSFIMYIVLYGYFIWYRHFYKNRTEFS